MTTATDIDKKKPLAGLSESGAYQKMLAFASLIALLIGFSIASPNFMQTSNMIAILQATSVNGVLAVAATLIIITGGIDLSLGTLMTFCAVIAGVALTYLGMPLLLGVAAAIAAGALCGLCSGTFVAKMKIPPFIATLGMFLVCRGIALWWSGGNPISFPTEGYAWIGSGMMPVVWFVLLAIVFQLIMKYTVYGKHTYAIGSNEDAARMSGINVRRHKVMVYMIASTLAAFAGIVLSSKAVTAQAGMGEFYELFAIAMAVIGGISLQGGRGSIIGTVLGAMVLGVIRSGFTYIKLDGSYQLMAMGSIIISAVILDQYRQRNKA